MTTRFQKSWKIVRKFLVTMFWFLVSWLTFVSAIAMAEEQRRRTVEAYNLQMARVFYVTPVGVVYPSFLI